MSKMVTFKGYSDDIVYVADGPKKDEHYGDGDKDVFATFIVAGPGGSVKVHAIYDGCWSFAVAQMDEGAPIPDWPMSVTHEVIRQNEIGYTTVLSMEVPDGTAVGQMKR